MSEFKGTKREWEARGNFVYNINKTHEIASIITYNNNQEEKEANAKLIACAPEMLDMLKNVKEYLENITGKHLSKPLANEIEQLIKKATS